MMFRFPTGRQNHTVKRISRGFRSMQKGAFQPSTEDLMMHFDQFVGGGFRMDHEGSRRVEVNEGSLGTALFHVL